MKKVPLNCAPARRPSAPPPPPPACLRSSLVFSLARSLHTALVSHVTAGAAPEVIYRPEDNNALRRPQSGMAGWGLFPARPLPWGERGAPPQPPPPPSCPTRVKSGSSLSLPLSRSNGYAVLCKQLISTLSPLPPHHPHTAFFFLSLTHTPRSTGRTGLKSSPPPTSHLHGFAEAIRIAIPRATPEELSEGGLSRHRRCVSPTSRTRQFFGGGGGGV